MKYKKRNTIYPAGELEVGDRFYFLSDTKKIAHTVVSISDNSFEYKKDQRLHPTRASLKQEVVYLRNINDVLS